MFSNYFHGYTKSTVSKTFPLWEDEDNTVLLNSFERVTEHKECTDILYSVPGLKKSEIEVTFKDSILKIKVKPAKKSEAFFKDASFEKNYDLSDTYEGTPIVYLKDGILKISCKKRAETQPKKLSIQGA